MGNLTLSMKKPPFQLAVIEIMTVYSKHYCTAVDQSWEDCTTAASTGLYNYENLLFSLQEILHLRKLKLKYIIFT